MPLAFPLELVKDEFAPKARSFIEDLVSPNGAATKLINSVNLVVRVLKPSDVGLSTPDWEFNLTSTEQTIVNTELDDKTMIVLFGVFNNDTDPKIRELKIGTPAGPIEDVQLDFMYTWANPALVFDEPLVFTPKSTIKIDAIASATGTHKMGFIGVVIEPAGRTINKPAQPQA